MNNFQNFSPDIFIPAIEEAYDTALAPFTRTFPSYINRVYELKTEAGESLVAKFYRPGRWTKDALMDEHQFIQDCAEAEIPVVEPLVLKNGSTISSINNINFALFPKRAGRQFDIEGDNSWQRVGSLLGRLHLVGAKKSAKHRYCLHPVSLTGKFVDELIQSGLCRKWGNAYKSTCLRIIDAITPFFDGESSIRLHGDFHRGNILERPDEGLMVIDFDDMMNGPAAQDLWLLLPEHYPACKDEIEQLLVGYRRFMDFSHSSLRLIEGLRAMRIIYFTHWCASQRNDGQFLDRFPEWGSDSFWSKEIRDIEEQYQRICEMTSKEFYSL